MSFDDTAKAELAKPLDKKHVKPPPKGKRGDYVEGWHVIAEANRIFGFDGWTRETVSMIETNRELLDLISDRGPYQQWRVGYVAKVRVSAGGISREGTGFGSGMSNPTALGEAIESAVKEAETDAMKRALMTFGNPFGLALYDKSQANVADTPAEPSMAFQSHAASLRGAKTMADLLTAFVEAREDKTITKAEGDELIRIKDERKAALSPEQPPVKNLGEHLDRLAAEERLQ
jgi:DNA repair and recombination protein RAD52